MDRIICGIIFFVFSVMGHANTLNLFISGGPNFSKLSNESLVRISSNVTNKYRTKQTMNGQDFGGIGIAHVFEKKWLQSYQFSLGVAGYFINLGDVHGTEYPFINAGSYDTLNYTFHVKSSTVLLESRFFYSQYDWQPFVLIGIGSGWNRLSGYKEVPSDPSLSAAPASSGFSNHTHQGFAYELGVGLQHQLWEDAIHKMQYKGSIGYRYFNLGDGQLGPFSAQTSNDRLQMNNLYTQGIVLALDVSFY